MSGLVALLGERVAHDERVVRRMLATMTARGGDRSELLRDGAAALGVTRGAWEFAPGFSGPVLAVRDGDCHVVADATLYYRDDLRRRLAARGVRPAAQTPSHLVLAAYRAFGESCAEVLEGDFAFVLWDRARRRLLAARDPMGLRPLYLAQLAGGVAIASTMTALREHPACPATLDVQTLALDAAALLMARGDRTVFEAIDQVPAGTTLVVRPGGTPTWRRWWSVECAASAFPRRAGEAADGLRAVLGDAIAERVAVTGPTALWMSGGYDSPALLAVGREALGDAGLGALRVVSASFPEGDSAREDETITTIAAHCGVDVHWVDGCGLALPFPWGAGARVPEEPFALTHGALFDRLVAGARDVGAQVVLHGHGGDFLFQASALYLADLVGTGRVSTAVREWRRWPAGGGDLRAFVKWGVEPLLPWWVRRVVGQVRGRPLVPALARELPAWLHRECVRQHALDERVRGSVPRRVRGRFVDGELAWYLGNPGFTRLAAWTAALPLARGVESRAPFLDARVIGHVLGGTWDERVGDGEVKRLLRRAMAPLLPPSVLARRPYKTGTLRTLLQDVARAAAAPLRDTLGHDARLVALGIADAAALARAVSRNDAGRLTPLETEQLLAAGTVEAWLRALERPPTEPALPSRFAPAVGTTAPGA